MVKDGNTESGSSQQSSVFSTGAVDAVGPLPPQMLNQIAAQAAMASRPRLRRSETSRPWAESRGRWREAPPRGAWGERWGVGSRNGRGSSGLEGVESEM